jgi:plastocyanin
MAILNAYMRILGCSRLKFLVFMLLFLSNCLMMVGCAKHEKIVGNTNSVIPSTTSNSTPRPTTSNPTNTPPSFAGRVSLAKPGEGPAEIWADKYDVYPNVLTVKMGTIVTFKNLDPVTQFTVVSYDGLFAGNITPEGGTWSYTFRDPGIFGFSIDPYNAELMGEVIVLG